MKRKRQRTRMIKPEVKFIDGVVGQAVVASDGLSHPLVPIAAGTGRSDRIGRKIIVTSLHIKGYLRLEPGNVGTVDDTAIQCRALIIRDKQWNNTPGQGEPNDFLENYGNDNIRPLGFRNLSNINRYTFLADKRFMLTTLIRGSQQFGIVKVPFEFHVDCDIPIEYSAGGSTGQDITSNNINFWLFSEQTQGQSEITATYITRTRYVDQ